MMSNLAYVDIRSPPIAANVGTAEEHIHLLLDHIKHTYPYWNRTGGRDHFLVSAPAPHGLGGLGSACCRLRHSKAAAPLVEPHGRAGGTTST